MREKNFKVILAEHNPYITLLTLMNFQSTDWNVPFTVIPDGGQQFRNVRQVGSSETFRLKHLKALQVRNIFFHRRLKWMNQENPLV